MSKNNIPHWATSLRRALTNFWFLCTSSVAILLVLVLFYYQRTDPGWSRSGNGEVQHKLGAVGAYSADILLSLFGYAAYLLPAGIFMMGWQTMRRRGLDIEVLLWKIFFLIISLCGLCGILSLHTGLGINAIAVTDGGLLGQKLGVMFLSTFGVAPLMLLYSICAIVGLTVVFEIHWFTLFSLVGRGVIWILLGIVAGLIRLTHRANPMQQEASANKRRSIKERLETKAPADTQPSEPLLFGAQPSVEPYWQDYPTVDDDTMGASVEQPLVSSPPSSEVEPPTLWIDTDEDDAFAPPSSLEEPAIALNPLEHKFNRHFAYAEVDETILPTPSEPSPSPVLDDAYAHDHTQLAEQALEDDGIDEQNAGIPSLGNRLRVNLPQTSVSPIVQTATTGSGGTYQFPGIELLAQAPPHRDDYSPQEIAQMKQRVEEALRNYRLEVTVVNVNIGPVVTRLELALSPGIKVSQITSLDKDIARSLAVQSVRVVEVIPGKSYIGLEIPNRKRETVYLRSVLSSDAYRQETSPLTLVLGADIAGKPVVTDLAEMPHLLVAGTTGSGKSVGINIMLTSMLYKATPDELKLILIDPKKLEMSMYEDIPHLLTPVVTDMSNAENALKWTVAEMERRYQLMAAMKVRQLSAFNALIKEKQAAGERCDDPLWNVDEHLGIAYQPPQLTTLPFIVIVIDELADMMMEVGKKVEELIVRIVQKARAAGIHLILATQRPSVDVITGLIKANINTRIAFQVSSKIDSRTIIDQMGAESLLGYGDMLFSKAGGSPQRVHGAFISDQEVDNVTSFVRTQGQPEYESAILAPVNPDDMGAYGAIERSDDPEYDDLYDEAVALIVEHGKVSISWLQRRLSIGYNRSARLIEMMEQAGIVSAPDRGKRQVLVPKPDYGGE